MCSRFNDSRCVLNTESQYGCGSPSRFGDNNYRYHQPWNYSSNFGSPQYDMEPNFCKRKTVRFEDDENQRIRNYNSEISHGMNMSSYPMNCLKSSMKTSCDSKNIFCRHPRTTSSNKMRFNRKHNEYAFNDNFLTRRRTMSQPVTTNSIWLKDNHKQFDQIPRNSLHYCDSFINDLNQQIPDLQNNGDIMAEEPCTCYHCQVTHNNHSISRWDNQFGRNSRVCSYVDDDKIGMDPLCPLHTNSDNHSSGARFRAQEMLDNTMDTCKYLLADYHHQKRQTDYRNLTRNSLSYTNAYSNYCRRKFDGLSEQARCGCSNHNFQASGRYKPRDNAMPSTNSDLHKSCLSSRCRQDQMYKSARYSNECSSPVRKNISRSAYSNSSPERRSRINSFEDTHYNKGQYGACDCDCNR